MEYETILCLIRFNVYFTLIYSLHFEQCVYFIEIFTNIKFSIITLLNKIIGELEEQIVDIRAIC